MNGKVVWWAKAPATNSDLRLLEPCSGEKRLLRVVLCVPNAYTEEKK